MILPPTPLGVISERIIMPLQEKLDALKAGFKANVPADIVAAVDQATEALIATGQALRALKAGDRAPAFSLPDADGNVVSSTDLLKKGPLVVSFYRGVWCPYCNLELQAIEAASSQIRDFGANVLAVSQQTPANSRKSQTTNNLSYPILADKGGDVAAAFGIRWALSARLKEIYEKLGADLAAFNGEASWTLPMPARYVIAQDGVIAYSEINPDYTSRPDPEELFPVLENLQTASRK